MKKVLLSSLLVCVIILTACSSNEENAGAASPSTEEATEVTAQNTDFEEEDFTEEMSFKDGKLETDYMTLTIDETQVGHDNMMDEDGLIIWYTVENTSDENIVPADEWYNFVIKQQDDSTEYDLTENLNMFDSSEALYPMYDENGDDIEDIDAYNQAIDDQEQFYAEYEEPAENELLPNKTKQFATSVTLNNVEKPVTVQIDDILSVSENEEYNINL